LQTTDCIWFKKNITFFIGDNGTGKSTLLDAITRKCGAHIWAESGRDRVNHNPYEELLHKFIHIKWANGSKPAAFFSSETFEHMIKMIDEWASTDPDLLQYFGGKSLLTQSHGESFMSFFRSRYQREGVYFLDEPESALSPRRQIEFLEFLQEMAADGHAQFLIATHSPILMSCPDATIYSFDQSPIQQQVYEETDHFKVYKEFLLNRTGTKKV